MEKKEKTVRRLLPCASFDVERIESWLSDMARDGLILQKDGAVRSPFRFRRGERKNLRYRLEPKGRWGDGDLPESGIRELCREYGWEFVSEFTQFYIFCAEDGGAREMNTDPAIHAMAFRWLLPRNILGNAAAFLAVVFLAVVYSGSFFRELTICGVLYTVGKRLLVALAGICFISEMFHLWGLYRRLKKHIPLDHNKPWKRGAVFYRMGAVSLVAAYLFFIITPLVQGGYVLSRNSPIGDYPGEPPIVTISDIFPEGKVTRKSWGSMDYNTFTQHTTTGAPLCLEWKEYAEVVTPDGEVHSGLLIVQYFETAADWIARGLAEEYWRDAQKGSRYLETELSELDVDFEVAYIDLVSPVIIMQKGNTMIKVTSTLFTAQDSMYQPWLEMMAEKLAE